MSRRLGVQSVANTVVALFGPVRGEGWLSFERQNQWNGIRDLIYKFAAGIVVFLFGSIHHVSSGAVSLVNDADTNRPNFSKSDSVLITVACTSWGASAKLALRLAAISSTEWRPSHAVQM